MYIAVFLGAALLRWAALLGAVAAGLVLPAPWRVASPAALALLYVASWLPGPRRYLRLGAPLCVASAAPRSERELQEQLRSWTDVPVVVGSAWTFYLQRRRVSEGPVLYTHRLRGDAAATLGEGWWWAGTRIAEVQAAWAEAGKTLHYFPSYTGITVGAWFAGGSHSGATRGDISGVASFFRLMDAATGDVVVVRASHLKAKLKSGSGRTAYVIVAAKLVAVDDALLVAEARRIDGYANAEWWLTTPSTLRVIFTGRGGSTGVIWRKPVGDEADAGPTLPRGPCGRLQRWLRHDVCASLCGTAPGLRGLEGVERLSSANHYVPFLPPLFPPLAVVGNVKNAELFVDGLRVDATWLYRFVRDCEQRHRKLGGRLELRLNESSGRFYVDMSFTPKNMDAFLAKTRAFGRARVSIHPGKAVVGV